jgi:glycosyltransferase involved in cell wall biosynthesis
MGTEKERILLFLTRIPYPPIDGTRSKILNNVVKGLATQFELDFLIVTSEIPKQDQIRFMEENFGRVFIFSFKRWRFILRALGYLFSSLPIQVGYYFHKEANTWFKSNLHMYNAVYVHGLRLGRYLEGLQEKERARLLIDFNDAISLNYKEAKKFAPLLWRLIYTLEEKRVREYEVWLLRNYKNFSIVSENDRRYLSASIAHFQEQLDIRFEYIPHGVDSQLLNYSGNFGRKIVFMGNLAYPPNRDAVNYFCRHIWPLLKSVVPDVRFIVIGNGKRFLEKRYPDILFTGFLENPYKLIAECSIFVAPLRFGAGVPTKLLEAMAIGVPVVTTPLGAQGILGARDGVNIFVLEKGEPGTWVTLLKELLGNSSLAMKVGRQAKRLVESQYSDIIAQEQFRKFFAEIATPRSAHFVG